MIYNNNIGTSKVFYSGFTITRVYACGGELAWNLSPFYFKTQYTLNDATSGEVVCNGDSTLKAIDFGSYEIISNIRYMTVGECVDSFDSSLIGSYYTSLRTLDLSHSNITIIQQDFMKNVTSLREVSLNPSATTINKDAFSGCTSLSAITIPASVTYIGTDAFKNCGFKDITIHSGITYGGFVYSQCSAATAVTIEQGTLRIEQGTFATSPNLASVTFPSSITYVGTQAFQGCNGIQSLTFTSTPPNLGENSFPKNNCPIYVPCSAMAAYLAHEDWQSYVDRLRPINGTCEAQYRWVELPLSEDYDCDTENYIKYYKEQEQVSTDSGYTWTDTENWRRGNSAETESVDCGYIPQYKVRVTTISGDTLTTNCNSNTRLTSAELPASPSAITSAEVGNCVTSLDSSVFASCSGLTSVSITNSVISIGSEAFRSCSGLTSVAIPDSVATIGNYAFYQCGGLASVIIGSGCTRMDAMAFSKCSQLVSITINATTPPTITNSTFLDTENCLIYVPAESVETYKTAQNWTTYADRIQAIQA